MGAGAAWSGDVMAMSDPLPVTSTESLLAPQAPPVPPSKRTLAVVVEMTQKHEGPA